MSDLQPWDWEMAKVFGEILREAYPPSWNGLGLPFEQEKFGVNFPGAWRRLYGDFWGYARDFGWRSVFLGGGCE